MRAYLDDLTLEVQYDEAGPLVYTRLPGSSDEVSVNDAYDGVGPLALQHFADGREAEPLPVDYDDVDGVPVYRVTTRLGDILFPAAVVPVIPLHQT